VAKTKTAKKTTKKSSKKTATAKKATAKKTTTKTAASKGSSKKSTKRVTRKDEVVKVDRRNPQADDRREKPAEVKVERRQKVNRRRQIDPTTCERDYSGAEVEFMQALDDYKRKNGRMFPTCSEILEVIRDLGYVKQTEGASEAVAAVAAPAPFMADSDAAEEAAFAEM